MSLQVFRTCFPVGRGGGGLSGWVRSDLIVKGDDALMWVEQDFQSFHF